MSFNQPPSLSQAIAALTRRVGILERRQPGVPRFMDLADADLSKIKHGQVPMYNEASGGYVPGNAGGGGARVYCDRQNHVLDSGSVDAQLEAEVEFTLTQTSTVGITIAYTFDQDPIAMSVPSSAFAWYLNGTPVVEPSLLRGTPVVATATTLGAGTHSIATTLTTGNLNLVLGGVTLMVVIGDDTGANCVET